MSLNTTITRLTKKFDVLGYLKTFGPVIPYTGYPNEYMITCPACKKPEHLGVNIHNGKWHCFRCGVKSRTIVNLMAMLEQISWRKALERLQDNTKDSEACDLQLVRMVLDSVTGLDATESDVPATIPLPLGYISLRGQQLLYTQQRRLSQEVIDRQRIGYCETGSYAGYLIIPDVDEIGNIVYWLGRHMTGGKPKTKNPPKAWAKVGTANRLFNYYRARHHVCGVLVEGWADALRVGEDAVATYGTGLKGNQLGMLLQTDFIELILMYDEDFSKEKLLDLGHQLAPFFRVKIAELDKDTDPDDYHSKQLKQIRLDAKNLPSRTSYVQVKQLSLKKSKKSSNYYKGNLLIP